MNSYVLVTGSEGYIGSILCKRLKEYGYFVVGVDSAKVTPHKYSDYFHNGCFTSPEVLTLIDKHHIKTVYHLAASSLLGPSASNPGEYFENNTGNTARLVKNLYNCNLIFASTAAVYKESNKPLVETDEKQSPNVYGRSKFMCEQIIDDVAPVNRISAVSFRFFNVIGAYDDLGQRSDQPHLLNQIMRSIHYAEILKVFGNDYDTRDGYCIRDFVHVRDIVEAMIHAARSRECKKHFGIHQCNNEKYNLGSGNGISVMEMIKMVHSVTKRHFFHRMEQRRIGDPSFLVADPSKFKNDYGFSYNHSIVDAIESTMRYYNV